MVSGVGNTLIATLVVTGKKLFVSLGVNVTESVWLFPRSNSAGWNE